MLERGATIPAVYVDGHRLVEPIHPRHAYVGPDGYRDIDVELSVREREDGAIVYRDIVDRKEPTAVVIELTAEGVEWLLDELPTHDRFTKVLAYARDLAKEKAWDRAAGRIR